MVSVGISRLRLTDLIFVCPGVEDTGGYYRDILLSQQLLPMMRDVSGDIFIFQQDKQYNCTPGTQHCVIS